MTDRKLVVLIAIFVILLAGCDKRVEQPNPAMTISSAPIVSSGTVARPSYDDDVVGQAVLDALYEKLPEHCTTNNDPLCNENLLRREEAAIACLRTWVTAQNVPDTQQREQYVKWLDFYTNEIGAVREANKLPKVEQPEPEYKAKERMVSEYKRYNPVPIPDPKCHTIASEVSR